MATLDGSIVNVALPNMAKSLDVHTSTIQLVVSIYLLVIAGTVLIFGRLGDMYGKSKMFKLGLALFTLGSLLCGITESFIMLVIARMIQAIGAAGTMANNQGIITEIFDHGERGKALGFLGTAVALGALVGPGIGGLIVGTLSWEYIFLINVPIGIIAYYYSHKLSPVHKRNEHLKLDIVGAILFIFAIVPFVLGLDQGLSLGYMNPLILGSFMLSFVSFVIFIVFEKKKKEPLLELSIFKNKLFSLSIFCAFVTFVALSCNNIIFPFYVQDVMNYSPLYAGLILMVNPLILMLVSPISGTLSDKIGSEVLTFIGLILVSVGLFFMSTLNVNSNIAEMIIFIVLMSIGMGLFQPPNNSLIMSTVPKNELGIAGSINALARNLGMVFGIAMSATLLYGLMSHYVGYKVTDFVNGSSDIFTNAMSIVYIVAGAISLIGAIMTLFRLIGKKTEKEEIIN
ncbi:Multidrug resistance protein 3 [compost metagenome]